jgi:type IV secretory pathway VirB10-like protein
VRARRPEWFVFVGSQTKVNSMAKQAADKDKDKSKEKPKAKPTHPGDDKAKKAKAKPAATADAAAEKAPAPEKPKPAPRPPADPRLKVLKKFRGKFLPRGPLRDRLKVLMQRWDSGEDHGGVTVDELRSLYDDWKTARAKPARAVKTQ